MKIETIRVLDVQTIGDTDSIEAGIDESSMPFLFELMSKNLYSNPIGSIIREITSNCVDSHKEAGVDTPVLIRKGYEEEDNLYTISFIDKGMGMSPERIRKVYMNYFSSTKRADNEQLGGYGLGSKAPFSYQDMFHIITRFEGREYYYILHRGESKPTLDLMDECATTGHNGTEIKVAIKPGDSGSFKLGIEQQLPYFDNVYVEGFEVNNQYEIIEGATFKYRSSIPYTQLHLVMDTVVYPIDYKQLGIASIAMPIGVKIGIGELLVTPNREAIRYTDEVKVLIKTRIEGTLAELASLYEKQPRTTSDIFEFIKKRSETKVLHLTERHRITLNHPSFTKLEWIYAPLAHLPIKMPANPFFLYESANRISSGMMGYAYENVPTLVGGTIPKNKIFYTKSPNRNEYRNKYIGNGWLIKRVKVSANEYLKELGLRRFKEPKQTSLTDSFSVTTTSSTHYYTSGNSITDTSQTATSVSGNTGTTIRFVNNIEKYRLGRVPYDLQLDKHAIVREYVQHIEGIVEARATDYQQVVVPQEFIDEYKANLLKEDYALQRKLNNKILVRYGGHNGKDEVALVHLEAYQTLVYGLRDHSELLDTWSYVVSLNTKLKSKRIRFIGIANQYESQVEKLPNAIHITDFIGSQEHLRLIRNTVTKYLIKGWFYDYYDIANRILTPEMLSIYQEMRKLRLSSGYPENRYVQKLGQFIEQHPQNYNWLTLAKHQQLVKYFQDFEVLKYIREHDIPEWMLGKLLKPFHKRLHNKYYHFNPTPPCQQPTETNLQN